MSLESSALCWTRATNVLLVLAGTFAFLSAIVGWQALRVNTRWNDEKADMTRREKMASDEKIAASEERAEKARKEAARANERTAGLAVQLESEKKERLEIERELHIKSGRPISR
jgi:hypothetical protein